MIFQNILRQANDSGYIALISAMITPVFLIVASGSLVNATLQRMTRVTDRARELIVLIGEDHRGNEHDQERTHLGWLNNYRLRSIWIERALISYYVAIGCFIASSLAIAFDRLMRDAAPWIAVVLVVCGAVLLFGGTLCLLLETTIASGMLRDEIAHAESLINHDEVLKRAGTLAPGSSTI